MASRGCDVKLTGVSILPNDVLMSGDAAKSVDLGDGTLDAGGFVLRLAD